MCHICAIFVSVCVEYVCVLARECLYERAGLGARVWHAFCVRRLLT